MIRKIAAIAVAGAVLGTAAGYAEASDFQTWKQKQIGPWTVYCGGEGRPGVKFHCSMHTWYSIPRQERKKYGAAKVNLSFSLGSNGVGWAGIRATEWQHLPLVEGRQYEGKIWFDKERYSGKWGYKGIGLFLSQHFTNISQFMFEVMYSENVTKLKIGKKNMSGFNLKGSSKAGEVMLEWYSKYANAMKEGGGFGAGVDIDHGKDYSFGEGDAEVNSF